jgi:dUTP pyrophosphatase
MGVVVKIKYHADIDEIIYIGGTKSNWIDLRCAEDVYMQEGEYRQISLGVSMELPEGYEAIVAPRSSTLKNFGVIMGNSLGVIDEPYCGDGDVWKFPAYAIRDTHIPFNSRIAQFRILKHQPNIAMQKVEHLRNPDRGGIGSTGKN